MITAIFQILYTLLSVFKWLIIAQFIMSWLLVLGIVDHRNRIVWTIGDFLYRVTEPVLGPIRRRLPSFNGIDFSPLVALLLVWVIQDFLLRGLYRGIMFGDWQALIF